MKQQPDGLIALVAADGHVFAFGVSTGLAVAVMAQWLANRVVRLSVPPMLRGLASASSYCVYAAFARLAVVFVRRCVRETCGRALEDRWRRSAAQRQRLQHPAAVGIDQHQVHAPRMGGIGRP